MTLRGLGAVLGLVLTALSQVSTSASWAAPRAAAPKSRVADGRAIAAAHGTSYQVRSADVGKRITVKVVASAGGRHTAVFSPATATVTT